MIREIECVAAFDAQKIAVRAALVAVIAADNFHSCIAAPDSQSCLAAVAAVRADRAHVLHFPGPRLVAICTRSQRTHGANIDAHAAFFAFQVIFFIRRDDRTHAAALHPQRPNVHGLAADAHAAVTQNATRPVEEHNRRPLLFLLMILRLHEFRFRGAVRKCHVLQFALAARVADRTVQGMIPQQHLDHALARLVHLRAVGTDDHAFAHHGGAGGLQLGHFFHLHQAHATRALQRQVRVVAKGRHLDARTLAGLNEQRSHRSRELLAVHCEIYISHREFSAPSQASVRSRLLSRTGTACLPNDLQTLYGTSSQTQWSASPPHPPADRTSGPACSPPGTACCRCLFSSRRQSENGSAFFPANPCLRGTGCTIRNFHGDKTSSCAKQTSRYIARHRSPPLRRNRAWNPPSPRNRNPC